MDNPRHLTTPTAQLIGSVAIIALAFVLILAVAALLDPPLERASERAREVAALAWIATVLDTRIAIIDRTAISTTVDRVLFDTTAPVVRYAPESGPHAGINALKMTTPDGYNGPIEFAFVVDGDGRITNVTVLSHEETRGYGAPILVDGAPWLAAFSGLAFDAPPANEWRLARAGGAIDGVSGATVTADAMITAIARGLRFLERSDGEARQR